MAAYKNAMAMLKRADRDHDKFVDKHIIDCKGMQCPGGAKVIPFTHITKDYAL